MVPPPVAAAVNTMVPVAATPAPLSASTPNHRETPGLIANHAIAWRWIIEPRPPPAIASAMLLARWNVSAAHVPVESFWPRIRQSYARTAAPCCACDASNSAITEGTRRVDGMRLKATMGYLVVIGARG